MPRHPSRPVGAAARLRTALARRPALARTAVLALALVVGLRVQAALADAERERAAWGDTRTVWVVDGNVARGAVVSARPEQFPVAVVPPGALTSVPLAAHSARPLADGWVLVDGDVVDDADVPTAWVVVAVPADAGPVVVEGDEVTLFEPGRALCDGVVTAPSTGAGVGSTIGVAVPPGCAAAAATALTDRSVVLGRRVGD